MKTIIVRAVTIISLCLIFWGCGGNTEQTEERQISSPYGGFMFESQRSQKIMKELWDAIEEENGERIAEMLSASARNEIEDYEGKIDNFINAFQGEITGVTEIATPSSKSRDNRKTTCYEITGMYDIETTKGIYSLDFSYIITNKNNPEEVGLYRICLRPNEKISEYKGMCGSKAGINVFPFED